MVWSVVTDFELKFAFLLILSELLCMHDEHTNLNIIYKAVTIRYTQNTIYKQVSQRKDQFFAKCMSSQVVLVRL